MGHAAQDLGIRAAEIRIARLTKRFGDLYAVRDVSLHIRKGDFYTFLGPSGCGKTTLLRMIAGFTRPDAGDIFFDEERVNDLPPWKREVGMVFQNFALWPHMSAFDNIAFGLRERKHPKDLIREKVHAALRMVELEGLEDRRPSQRTLVIEPRGLLLDEPLSSLDAKLRLQMRNELVRLQGELGITTLYVTHDQEEALALSTRVAVFSRGEVIQEGTPKEVYESPMERSVADFVGTSNFLSGMVEEVSRDSVLLEVGDSEPLWIRWQPSLEAPPRRGTSLLICIRPESISMTEHDEDAAENRISGQVRSSIYLGSQVQYDVDIGADHPIKVNLFNPRRLPVLPEGTQVYLGFASEDAVLLPAGGAGKDPAV